MTLVLEAGQRRVFARCPEWPGWCRSGRDEAAALEALSACRNRYAAAVMERVPKPESDVAERLSGTQVTDFGALGVVAASDRAAWTATERGRLLQRLAACWAAFDSAFNKTPVSRRDDKPQRGRSVAAIALHVLETELMHVAGGGGGPFRKPSQDNVAQQLAATQGTLLDALHAAPVGTAFVPSRKAGFDWTPRFVVQRSAWHALDHAWEIEDRA